MTFWKVMGAFKADRPATRLAVAGLLLAAAMIVILVHKPDVAQSQSGAIDNLQLTSSSPGEIQVTWDRPSPAPSDYRVSWAPVGQDYLSWRASNETLRGNEYPSGNATSLRLTGLREGTEFKVKMRSRYNPGRNSFWSGPWTAEKTVTVAVEPTPEPTPSPTQEVPEGTVTGLSLTSSASGSLTIGWDTPSPAPSDYRIGWAAEGLDHLTWSSPNEASRGNEYPGGDTNSLTLTGLTGGTEFRVYMRARYSTGRHANAPWSGPWTGSLTQRVLNDPPEPPSNLQVDSADIDGVVLRWATSTHDGLTGYRILRGQSADELSTLVELGTEVPSHTDTTTEADETYHYAVVVLSLDGDSPPSAAVSTTVSSPVETDSGSPNPPSGLTASYTTPKVTAVRRSSEAITTRGSSDAIGARNTPVLPTNQGYVALSWTNPTGGVTPTGYQVKRWIMGYNEDHPTYFDCDSFSTSTPCRSAASYRDSRLRSSVTYSYAVRLVKRAEGDDPLWSLWSETVRITIPVIVGSRPPAPTGLNAIEVLHETNDPKVLVTWTAVSGTSTYTIVRTDLDAATSTPVEIATGLTVTTYDDTAIVAYRSYQYRVRAVNSVGEGPLSQLEIVNTSGLRYGIPDRPTDISATTTAINATTTAINSTSTESSATSTDPDTLITLSWTPATGGATSTSYFIYAGALSEEEYRSYEHPADLIVGVWPSRRVSTTTATYSVRSGRYYGFGVVACNLTGCSSLSEGVEINLIGDLEPDPGAPGQPTSPSTS